jgi:hypothetical protein
MKLWRVTYHDDNSPSGIVTQYFPSKRAALAACAALLHRYTDDDGEKRDGFFIYPDSPEAIDVPTTRAALVAWLNQHAASQ